MTQAEITRQYLNLRARAKKAGYPITFTADEYRAWYVAQFPDTASCPYCHLRLATGKPEPDHRTPMSRGGDTGIQNLILCCHRCNRRKGELTDNEWEQVMRLMYILPEPARKYIDNKLYARPIYRR